MFKPLILAMLQHTAPLQTETLPVLPPLSEAVVNVDKYPALLDGLLLQQLADGPALQLLMSEGNPRRLDLVTYGGDGESRYRQSLSGSLERAAAQFDKQGGLVLQTLRSGLNLFDASGRVLQHIERGIVLLFTVAPLGAVTYNYLFGFALSVHNTDPLRGTSWVQPIDQRSEGQCQNWSSLIADTFGRVAGMRIGLAPLANYGGEHVISICRYQPDGTPLPPETLALTAETEFAGAHPRHDGGWWLLGNPAPAATARSAQLWQIGAQTGIDEIGDFGLQGLRVLRSAMSEQYLVLLVELPQGAVERQEFWWLSSGGRKVATVAVPELGSGACDEWDLAEMTPSSQASVRLTFLPRDGQTCSDQGMVAELDSSGRWLRQLPFNAPLTVGNFRGTRSAAGGYKILRSNPANREIDELQLSATAELSTTRVEQTFTDSTDYSLALGQTRAGILSIGLAEETLDTSTSTQGKRQRSFVAVPFDRNGNTGATQTLLRQPAGAREVGFLPSGYAQTLLRPVHFHVDGAWLALDGRLYGLDPLGVTYISAPLGVAESAIGVSGDRSGGWLASIEGDSKQAQQCVLRRFGADAVLASATEAAASGSAGQLWTHAAGVILGCEQTASSTVLGLRRVGGAPWRLELPLQRIKAGIKGKTLALVGFSPSLGRWNMLRVDTDTGAVLSDLQFDRESAPSIFAWPEVVLINADSDLIIAWSIDGRGYLLERRRADGSARWQRFTYWEGPIDLQELASGDLLVSAHFNRSSILQLNPEGCARAQVPLDRNTGYATALTVVNPTDQRVFRFSSRFKSAGDSDLVLSSFQVSTAPPDCTRNLSN